ncbi:uncharacterized protein LOC122644961 [Telopea speciosissima]|uniref:uncharacterized protein LOC122644961 n=1 Tax=Telopea speciosissima TaxID=54955 RepID=UPI001CC5CC98|nr:uncharacterized protein LOC122644961 [Telopea speciosissima]
MKEHLKFLNRPAVKTIQTAYGDIFDCVGIYKQPALDHPLLKNHTIQMRPSTYPKGLKFKGASSSKAVNIALKNGGCPLGTVPIRRTQMKEIVRATSLSKLGKKIGTDLHYYGFAQMKDAQYYGTQASLNVWNPNVGGNSIKFTLSQIWIVAGPHSTPIDTIEAGWMVYHHLFGDFRTRLFTFWTADNYGQTGCYNLACPGFVLVSQEIGLGMVLDPVSVYNGSQTEIILALYQDMKTGNWWLALGSTDKMIGYWPHNLFKFLNINAAKVAWGGEVFGDAPHPEMGSAHFPEEGFHLEPFSYLVGLVVIAEPIVHAMAANLRPFLEGLMAVFGEALFTGNEVHHVAVLTQLVSTELDSWGRSRQQQIGTHYGALTGRRTKLQSNIADPASMTANLTLNALPSANSPNHGSSSTMEGTKSSTPETHNRLTSVIFNGQNFLPWARAITIALGGRSKLGYINGTIKPPDLKDTKFAE